MQQTPQRPDYRAALREHWATDDRRFGSARDEQRREIASEIMAEADAMTEVIRREIAAGIITEVQRSTPGNGEAHTAAPVGIAIDPNTIYSRQNLLAMGMPRRMLDAPEIKAAAVRTNGRFMYTGSKLKAAMEANTAEQRRRARPVAFKGDR